MSDQVTDLENLRNAARTQLKSNHVDRALRTYGQILEIHPEDLDSWLILGDAFFVSGDHLTAYAIYENARKFSPDGAEIDKRMSVLQLETHQKSQASLTRLYPISDLVDDLVVKLPGYSHEIPESDMIKARQLMEQVLKDDSPAEAVAKNFAEIDQLLPALIEINLRQAKLEGKTEIVRALKKIQQQLFSDEHQGKQINKKPPKKHQMDLRILLTGECTSESQDRFSLLFRSLQQSGYDVFCAGERDGWMDWSSYDMVVVQNPHSSVKVIQNIAGFFSTGKPLVVDLSNDFELMPPEHQDSERFGLHTFEKKKNYYAAMYLADHLVVNNAEFAQNLQKSGFSASYVPDGWDSSNPLWFKSNHSRGTFNLGLICQPGQDDDMAGIRRAIIRILREFPHTRLVISGNLSTYRLFDQVSDTRKLFLPPVSVEEQPYLYSHMDVLLLPMADTYFNQLRSDRVLMEAGVKKLPWIASSLRFVEAWGVGGLQVDVVDDWYTHLHSVVTDEDLRNRLGEKGFEKVQDRDREKIVKKWQQLISQVMKQKISDKGAPVSAG